MSDIKRIGDLEISQDLEFQQKEWMAERIGWFFMALIVLAGMVGLLGVGPVSRTVAKNDLLQVTYYRFDRLMAPSTYQILVSPEAVVNGELRLRVSRDLLAKTRIEKIVPEPHRVEFSGDSLVYTFTAVEVDQPLRITFYHRPEQVGSVRGSMGVEGGSAVVVRHFFFP
jgi:hypothetical protein